MMDSSKLTGNGTFSPGPYDARIQCPFNMIMAGPTKSGKTTFCLEFLKSRHDMWANPPQHIFLFYQQWQPAYKIMEKQEGVKLRQGFPTNEELKRIAGKHKLIGGSLIILDDAYSALEGDLLVDLFLHVSHHQNASVIVITQALYMAKSPSFRTLSLNTHYFVLFKSPRMVGQVATMGSQLFQGYPKGHLLKAYTDATRDRRFSYLFVDFMSQTPEQIGRAHV